MREVIEGMLEGRSDDVKGWDDAFERGLKKASAGSAPEPGVNVSNVSFRTIWNASGKRSLAPSQRRQMGGSATVIAQNADWPTATERIGRQGKWDAPGCYPAEWLHRSAFSWGNGEYFLYPQATYNLVFGSSEANSLMTRYEKAWQRLFVNEWDLAKELQLDRSLPNFQHLKGVLTTRNTPDDTEILTTLRSVDPGPLRVKDVLLVKGETKHDVPRLVDPVNNMMPVDVSGPEQGGEWPDYWVEARTCRNLSWCLTYELQLFGTGELNMTTATQIKFYPFQRGFYTRLEAEVDSVLLDNRVYRRLSREPEENKAPAKRGLVVPMGMLTLNPSPQAHTADVWRRAHRGEPLSAGGVTLNNPSLATLDASGRMMHIPLPANETTVPPATAFVARVPLAALNVGSAVGDKAPTEAIPVSAVTHDVAPGGNAEDNIPDGFVLQGSVKLFGQFEAPMYIYHGSAAVGTRQMIPLAGVVDSIEKLVPGLAETDYSSAIRFKNTELMYSEVTTATYRAGTWLQTDIVFSGRLQPVNDCLKNVFLQADPVLRVQALLTPKNDWSKPISTNGIALRGMLPGMDVRIGSLLRVTQLGIDVSLTGSAQPWKPYKMEWRHSIGFSGDMLVEMPHDMAPLSADFLMTETKGLLTLMVTVKQFDKPGFAGVTGLKLSGLTLQTSLGIGQGASASVTDFRATAELGLRDSTLQLYGYYSKTDWGLTCELRGFTLADLRSMYQDIFGATLHFTDHDIKLGNLSFMARPSGLTIDGSVTIEGHTSAKATIVISRNGLDIRGEVADVPIEGDLVLKKASLDIFVGREDTLPLAKPGTSFRFAIQGIVDVADSEISATMFLDRDSQGNALWTVVGGFEGAFSLSKIASALRGTFLDLSVQEATFIASNVDGGAAAGAVIPGAYPVLKGIQIAGALGSIPALDGALGVSSSSSSAAMVTGLTLHAMYSATSSSFEVGFRLPSARQMSMKGGTVYSGPISLLVQASASPTLVLNADFFVKVPNQAEPLRFSGGLAASISEAKLFIELANQWWQNPFGLSPQLKLGPTLALGVGIVYAGPVYPSEIGVAAGLAIGDVSGAAALFISDTPTDELIMLHIDNLGIKDLVSFASLLLQTSLPTPEDFLRFTKLDFYLSSGTTIGTTVYPPGASFSCDAVLFGHDGTVSCSVSKAQKQIQVSGSLGAIAVGPLSVSGYEPGTPARLDVQFGVQHQTVAIDGGVSLFDLDARVLVKADIMPSPSFQLQTELDFTAHLTFQLQANMRSGTTGTAAGLQGLDFDVHAVFQQDLLDYLATQINAQALAAKKAIDDGEKAAQKALDRDQAEYQAAIDAAQTQVDIAKLDYETKLNAATAALSAEESRANQQSQELTRAVDEAVETFNAAVNTAQRSLQEANDERARQIQAAKQKVEDAKAAADRDIDNHLRDLNNAKDDMNRRFSDALGKIQSAKDDVNSLQGQVNDAQNALNNAQRDLDNASFFDKIPKVSSRFASPFLHPSPLKSRKKKKKEKKNEGRTKTNLPKQPQAFEVTAQSIRLGSVQAALSAAQDILSAAEAVVRSPGYLVAAASIDAYQQAVDTARTTANASIDAATATLQATQQAQDGLVAEASATLTLVQTSGVEKGVADAARAALDAFSVAEAATLGALRVAVDAVGKSTEAAAFETANVALRTAVASTAAVDAARAAVRLATQAGEAVVSAAGWMATHAANLLEVKRVEVSGDLRAACASETQLAARLVGTFAGEHVDFSVGFTPGKGEDMVKTVFEWLIGEVKKGVLKIGS